MKPALHHRRRGFTLIETVLVFGLELAVFAIAAGLLILTAETRAKWQQREPIRLAAQRLAVQFRRDIHNAEKITAEKETLTLVLTTGEDVVYTVEAREFPEQKQLQRAERKDGKRIREEYYPVPDNSVVWFVEGKDAFVGLTALNIWTQAVNPDGEAGAAMPALETLNSFTRECTETPLDPRYAARWRVIIARK